MALTKMNSFVKIFSAGLMLALAISASTAVEPEFTDVFVAGKDGFPSIRIPSVVVTKSGVVLALAEGRAKAADQANNKIILKRSLDGGKTWGAQQIIADDGENCLNNPCAVVDEKNGRIIVMFQSYPFGYSERDGKIQPGLDGPAIVRNDVIHSDDDGLTWSKLEDVTRTTKHAERVTTMASGPGIGIQLKHGAHAGRILIPFNEGPFGHWNVLAVLSDDGGGHWQVGEPAPGCCVTNANGKVVSLVNEVQMVELSDGTVMLNSRKWGGQPVRKIAVSHDGGVTWSKIEDAPTLRDPGCMASIINVKTKTGKGVLLYSGPDSTKRENGTIHLSYDDGRTWPVKKVLFPGSFAYSVLTQLPNGDIGCLFETDNANRIVFARFPLEWLTDDKDVTDSNAATGATTE
jgi:sialidase-1